MCITAQRAILFEQPFVRLLHLLAHHPDFVHGDDEEEIKVMAKSVACSLFLQFRTSLLKTSTRID